MQRHLRRIDRTAKGQKIAMEDLCQLTPAYDLLNVAIVNPADREELALSLNGKKSNLKKEDFLIAGETMGIENSVVEHLIRKYLGLEDKMSEIIDVSFLSSKYKIAFRSLISSRMERLK